MNKQLYYFFKEGNNFLMEAATHYSKKMKYSYIISFSLNLLQAGKNQQKKIFLHLIVILKKIKDHKGLHKFFLDLFILTRCMGKLRSVKVNKFQWNV